MHIGNRVNGPLKAQRDEQEVQQWMFSLAPLGVAFVFFLIFLLPMEIASKDTILVMGLAAGFAGLEAYWVYRGWQRAEGLTVLLGLVGIALTALFTWAYIQFFGAILRDVFAGWAA